MDVSGDGWSDLRGCLFLGKGNVFAGAPLGVEAVLADFDALPDGAYEATFAVTDAAGRLHPREPPRHLGPVGRDVSIAPPEGGPTDRTTRGGTPVPDGGGGRRDAETAPARASSRGSAILLGAIARRMPSVIE